MENQEENVKVEINCQGCGGCKNWKFWKNKEHKHHYHKEKVGCLYGLGVIGAAVYFISTAEGFWIGVLGVLKAFVWPAIVVYKLLDFLYLWK